MKLLTAIAIATALSLHPAQAQSQKQNSSTWERSATQPQELPPLVDRLELQHLRKKVQQFMTNDKTLERNQELFEAILQLISATQHLEYYCDMTQNCFAKYREHDRGYRRLLLIVMKDMCLDPDVASMPVCVGLLK